MKKTVVLSVNSDWNIINFRSGLVKSLLNAGYEVCVFAPAGKYVTAIKKMGCSFYETPMRAQGLNPVSDILLLVTYWKYLRKIKPLVYLGFTIKPNIYGSLVCSLLGIKALPNVTGLGTAFNKRGGVFFLVSLLYRLSFRKVARVFFQNKDDKALFLSEGLVKDELATVVPGSGVDLKKFVPKNKNICEAQEVFVFLIIARLLVDKGIEEFFLALNELHLSGHSIKGVLIGRFDEAHPSSINRNDLKEWEKKSFFEYAGEVKDVRPHIETSHCIVLPTLNREGTPRSLLEGGAMAKPLIATRVPGCQDVIEEGGNGYLVEAGSSSELAAAMKKLLSLSDADYFIMCSASRKFICEHYDEDLVIEAYMKNISTLESLT